MAGGVRHVLILSMILAGLCLARPADAQSSGPGPSGQGTFAVYLRDLPRHVGEGRWSPGKLNVTAPSRSHPHCPTQSRYVFCRPGRTDHRRPKSREGAWRGEMPVWGDAFAKTADTTPVDEKIRRLVRYLESIQVKP